MTRAQFSVLLILTALLNGNSSASDAPVGLVPVRGDVQFQDLSNLAEFMGIRFKSFDYETAEPRCIHFYVDEKSVNGETIRHDGGGECGLAGSHRLTVQWKVEDGSIDFRFVRYRRDVDQGSSVWGPKIAIPGLGGQSLKRIDPPQLEIGRPALVLSGSFWSTGTNQQRMEFKVLVELRPNPTGIIGTE